MEPTLDSLGVFDLSPAPSQRALLPIRGRRGWATEAIRPSSDPRRSILVDVQRGILAMVLAVLEGDQAGQGNKWQELLVALVSQESTDVPSRLIDYDCYE